VRQFLRNASRARRRGALIESYLRTHDVRKLQLGAGEHPRPDWLNTDLHDYGRGDELVYLDVRKPFPLPDASLDFVYSEHMIEHLTYAEGQHCLRESLRVLKPGGRIRIATPSLERLAALYDGGEIGERYVTWAVETLEPEVGAALAGVVINNFFRSWGHRFVYDPETLTYALSEAGFVEIEEAPLGELERHLADRPEFNQLETFVLEAQRAR
jgi:predicted SAM-dependent methyltransferase